MTALIFSIGAPAVSVFVAFLAIKYALAQRKRRIASDGLLEAYQEGEKLRAQLAKKTEAIKHEQAADKAKVDTGDPIADFDASIGVLSDRAARRRTK